MNINSASVLDESYYYEDLDLKILDFKKYDVPPHWSMDLTTKDVCNLSYVVDGRAVYYVDDRPYILNKGDFVFIPDGVAYSAYADRRSHLVVNTILFLYTYGESSSRKLPIPTVFNVEKNIVVKDFFNELGRIWEEKARGYRLMAKVTALKAFHELIFRSYHSYHDMQHSSNENQHSNRIDIIKEYIHKHYNRDIQLEDIADMLKLNPIYMGSYFKKCTGYSISHYVNCVRVSQAKSLLTMGRYSVSEVAEQCGYNDCYYFSKVFKQIEGVPPSLYQR